MVTRSLQEFAIDRMAVDGLAEADYNVAPTKNVPMVLARELHAASDSKDKGAGEGGVERELHAARWGLVPS